MLAARYAGLFPWTFRLCCLKEHHLIPQPEVIITFFEYKQRGMNNDKAFQA